MGIARITSLLVLGANLWAASPSAVEAGAPKPLAEVSATVTVTAEATPVELVQTPNPVVVLDQAAIGASGATSLGDLLQVQLPGQVFTSGGVGSVASLYLGGSRAQDTVVTLDGLRLEDATGLGGVNANLISLAGLDRVEIQQGPCSTRFGSDALGGAVALYSAGSAPAGASGEIRAAAGNQGIVRGALGAAYGWDQGWVRVAVTGQKEDQVLDPSSQYRNSGTFLGLGRQLGEDTLVTASYVNDYSKVPAPISYVSDNPPYRAYDPDRADSSRTQVASATVRTQFSATLSGELTLGQVLQNRLEPNTTDQAMNPFDSRRNQAVGHLTWEPSRATSLTLGLDGSEEHASNPDLLDTTLLTASATHLAVLAEGSQELCPDLRAVASLRTERDRQSSPSGQGPAGATSIAQTTGKLGLNWILPKGFRAFANAGTGFSTPLLYDALFNAQYGGVALDNEKSRSAQAGLTYASGPWKAGLVLSRTLFSSLVYYDPTGGVYIPSWQYNSGIYRNGSQLRTQSAELKGGYATAVWGLSGFYRNQEARNLAAASGQQLSTAASMVRSPFQTLGADAFRVIGAVKLSARWSWIGPRYEYGLPTGTAFNQHYNDLSLAAAWTARKDLTLTLRGDNLLQPRTTLAQWQAGSRDFQNDASQEFGYPAQPPTVNLEVRYRF